MRVKIDVRKIYDLGKALSQIAREAPPRAIAPPLNATGDRLYHNTRDKLQKWTGLQRSGVVSSHMSKHKASGGKLSYTIRVKSGWFAITSANFNARWSRSSSGVSHSAWQGGNTERGTFMHNGVAYHRTSSSRYPIKVVYGPNIARELERNAGEVRAMQHTALRRHYIPRVYRGLDRLAAKAKATYGL
jgi:hypothetical protein